MMTSNNKGSDDNLLLASNFGDDQPWLTTLPDNSIGHAEDQPDAALFRRV